MTQAGKPVPGRRNSPERRVILFADLAESVRLMSANEAGIVQRWRQFLKCVRTELALRHGGRFVKSLGDGVLLDFEAMPPALAAAFELHALMARIGGATGSEPPMMLRVALHIADVIVDEVDLFGAGVNLAARLLELARPGETVVSIQVRDALVDSLDANFTDLGDCFLKHLPQAVRAFRAASPGQAVGLPTVPVDSHLPLLAVVPFRTIGPHSSSDAVGDALADGTIGALSRIPGLRLSSRLSTAALRHQSDTATSGRRYLAADFVLTGQYLLRGQHIATQATLMETGSGQVRWCGQFDGTLADLFDPAGTWLAMAAAEVGQAIVRTEVHRARGLPLPSLENFTLYISGVAMMHRMSQKEFQRARQMFEELVHRLPRNPAPRAMLAKWHLMRMLQGWSPDPAVDGQQARDMARRALDQDPEHAFALATEGFVAAHFSGDLAHGRLRCEAAVESDPQDAQAWRMLAGIHSYLGDATQARDCAARALALTPLDPARFLYELILGAAELVGGRPAAALRWADQSLRRNALHLPAHRLRVMALSLDGQAESAHKAALDLLRLKPDFNVDGYARQYPGRDQPHASGYFEALRKAGIPG